MRNYVNELLEFCRQYEAVICYGASDHGYMVKHFLNRMGIKVQCFLVSDEIQDGTKRDGVDIYSIKDIKNIPDNYGIVLSLYERHHSVVKGNLLQYAGRARGIYEINMQLLHSIRVENLKIQRYEELKKAISLDADCSMYQKRICEIKKNYEKILVGFIDVRRLGAYSLWGYYLYRRSLEKNGKFYLYYPVTQEHRPEEHLRGSNGYLLGKLAAEGIAVISEKNIDFWRLFFQKNKAFFSFNDEYREWGWKKELAEVNGNASLSSEWIQLNQTEKEIGEKSLVALGIDKDFVCISARDSAYLQSAKRDVAKEDFRDRYRNSDIKKHQLALSYLGNKGIQGVRLGAKVEKAINDSNIIDYASLARTEFMDLYLASACKFFVSDLSGIFVLANMFGKNKVILNAPLLTTKGDSVPFLHPGKDIAILKKLWNKKTKKFLTLKEMLFYEVEKGNIEENIQGSVFGFYYKNDILPIENTEEEILEVIKEMNERIEKNCKYDILDCELQHQYREIVDEYYKKDNFLNNWRLGAAFLRKNQWLLE
jgi:putative glycosyltransferase (TIGR04372 family)